VRRWRQIGWPVRRHQAPLLSGPIARNRLRPGLVVWAHIPFVDRAGWKTRPTIVVSVNREKVCVLPAYSTPSRWRFASRYVELRDLDQCRLPRRTGVRLRPIMIDAIEIVSVAGELNPDDWDRISLLAASDRHENGEFHG
jgi:hypothetical protein